MNRLTIGLVTAALIVGSSILMAASSPQHSFVAWFLGFVGVVASFATSVWLFASLRRSR